MATKLGWKARLAIGALALYALAWIGIAAAIFVFNKESFDLTSRAVELGEKHAPLPTTKMGSLKQACAGRLPPGGARAIAGYVARIDPSKLPSLPESYMYVDQALIGVHDVIGLALSTRHMKEATPPRLADAIKTAADSTRWSRQLKRAYAGDPEMRETKYLVVARYESLTMPRVDGLKYDQGGGAWGARVLSFPSGDVLCEGRGRVRMKNTVTAGGRGPDKSAAQADARERVEKLVPSVFTQSVVTSPLHDVCDAGGKQLCNLTAYWVGWRDE